MHKPDLINLYGSLRDVLSKARNNTYRAISDAMLQAYWEMGRLIVENEQKGQRKAAYGKAVIKELSARLTMDFGPGFGEQALRNYRQFFLLFPIRASVRRELSWTHYRLIIRVSNKKAREYYLQEAVAQHWSVRTLGRHINSLYYERLLSSHDKTALQKESTDPVARPQDILKDPMVLEFLDLPAHLNYRERDMEKAIISHLQQFLLELGKGFAFIARQ